MTQFTVYKNPNRLTQKNYPYLLDIQTNLLSTLRTTVVIPLMPKKLAGDHIISRLNPALKIKNENFILMTQNIAGVDRDVLGAEVCELHTYRSAIISAVDFVLAGI